MRLNIKVGDRHASHIEGETLEEIAESWNWLNGVAAARGLTVNAQSWTMTQEEEDALQLVTNVPPEVERLLSVGGWTEVGRVDGPGEALPLPVLNFDQPKPDYSGAGLGSVPMHHSAGGPGAPLALPKLF